MVQIILYIAYIVFLEFLFSLIFIIFIAAQCSFLLQIYHLYANSIYRATVVPHIVTLLCPKCF